MAVYMGGHSTLEARIHRLTLERQYAEHTLVYPAQRLATDEPIQSLDPQREFPKGERPLGGKSAVAQTLQVIR